MIGDVKNNVVDISLIEFMKQPSVGSNPKPQTPNPKPQTPNPKPQTPKLKSIFKSL